MEDAADSDFIKQLFRENNDLRLEINSLSRELHNKIMTIETIEDEMRELNLKMEFSEDGFNSRPDSQNNQNSIMHIKKSNKATPHRDSISTPNSTLSKELESAVQAIDRKGLELRTLKEELAKVQLHLEHQIQTNVKRDEEVVSLQDEIRGLKKIKNTANHKDQNKDSAGGGGGGENSATPGGGKLEDVDVVLSDEAVRMKMQIESQDVVIQNLKNQLVNLATDTNRKHNEQQSQLQGVEALMDSIRIQYDEFIQVIKVDSESFRQAQQAEYDNLKIDFDRFKIDQMEEKKKMALESQAIQYFLQTQFDEYKTTVEYLFNVEVAKLEDELSSQALRDQQESVYIIQAKDKFYTDMMVAKDAKIMSLIEGSDLQSLMQKHELDIENLRKDHQREIERVKSDQESEQKNLIALLQRQNVSLESKCEKLQSHLKSMENRIRELMATIEAKNKAIGEREDQRVKLEMEFSKKIEESKKRIDSLTQEKEHLRHKVIRLNLNARGEGANTIENMETSKLHSEFENVSMKYDEVLSENQAVSKLLKEKEKLNSFLEGEILKRNSEFQAMTQTFEEFLSNRARQARKDRSIRLLKLNDEERKSQTLPKQILFDNKMILKASIPAKGDVTPKVLGSPNQKANDTAELERGLTYLRKFKTLSRTFATGDFKYIPFIQKTEQTSSSKKNELYTRMNQATEKIIKIYADLPPPQDGKSKLNTSPTRALDEALKGGMKKIYDGKSEYDGFRGATGNPGSRKGVSKLPINGNSRGRTKEGDDMPIYRPFFSGNGKQPGLDVFLKKETSEAPNSRKSEFNIVGSSNAK